MTNSMTVVLTTPEFPETKGRQNWSIWNRVNWDNSDMAIARRLRCNRRAVKYQREKRGLPPSDAPRGGSKTRGLLPYVEGPNPLPAVIPSL